MVSWIGTRLFYALIFFMLGAWVASVSPGFKGALRNAGAQGFETLRDWTSSTLRWPSDQSAVKANELTPKAATATTPAAPAVSSPVGAELLINARAAYARRDILGAINAYRAYIDRNPGAIEARGELGNVYFASGRLRDAGQVYFEAAMLKLKSGDIASAKAMLNAVRQGDGALGDDLSREIVKAETGGK